MEKFDNDGTVNDSDQCKKYVHSVEQEGEEGAPQEHIPFHVLAPFVHQREYPYTHRCWKIGCSMGQSTTIFGSESASIRKSEPCSVFCPFQACNMESNTTVPWSQVKVASVYEGSVPPEVWRALAFAAIVLFVVVVVSVSRSLGIAVIVVMVLLEVVVVLLLALLFRETYGEFTGKYLHGTGMLLARIQNEAIEEFLQEAKAFMDSRKWEAAETPVLVDKEYSEDKTLCGMISLGGDTLRVQGDTGELYKDRTPCGITCLRSKTYHRFRIRDVMWTYGERSRRNIYVLIASIVMALILLVAALRSDSQNPLSSVAFLILLLGIAIYYLSATPAMTFGLPTKTMLTFSPDDSKIQEISDTILSSQIGREINKDPVQRELDGFDLSQQSANLKVFPDHIRHTTTYNWKNNPCCCCCRCCCEQDTTRCIGSVCGYTQLSGKYNKRTYIGASTAGNPMALVAGILSFLVGLFYAVNLTVDLDQTALPWIGLLFFVLIGGISLLVWWYSRKLLLSMGVKGTDLLPHSVSVVDPTGSNLAIWFRPNSGDDCHQLVEEIDSLARSSVRREMLTNQQCASMKEDGDGVTMIERKTKEGEFYYENPKNGNTAWNVRPYQPIYCPDMDASTGTAEP